MLVILVPAFLFIANLLSVLSCPVVKPVNNFNIKRFFSGKWYEISRYNNFDLEVNSDCTYGIFDYDNGVYNFTMNEVVQNKLISYGAQVKIMPDTNKTARVIYAFDRGAKEDLPLIIVDTDYVTYGIMYFCNYDEKSKVTREFAWILSRSIELPAKSQAAVDTYINSSHIFNAKNFVKDNFRKKTCIEIVQ